jgi:hypothetical protein
VIRAIPSFSCFVVSIDHNRLSNRRLRVGATFGLLE